MRGAIRRVLPIWHVLTLFLSSAISSASCSLRASSGDVRRMEQDAAPAGEARNLALGTPRNPARAVLWPLCREPTARSAAPMPQTEARDRGVKSPRWSAERRARRSQDARHASQAWLVAPIARRDSAPLGAPLPSQRGALDDGVPGAANNTGGEACLDDTSVNRLFALVCRRQTLAPRSGQRVASNRDGRRARCGFRALSRDHRLEASDHRRGRLE
jgi:hypothetical protein